MQIFPGISHRLLFCFGTQPRTSASWVFSFCFCGLSVEGELRGCGNDNNAANNDVASGRGAACCAL